MTSKPTTSWRGGLSVSWIDCRLDPIPSGPHLAKSSLDDAEFTRLLREIDFPSDRGWDAVTHDVPAGAVTPVELLLFREGKGSPDALTERAQLVHNHGRVHSARTKQGTVFLH